ncbi:hypothetical protein JW979_05140 [bacterium]|nr:hypothetical protein [candidate division CSSED10-310 bacterium]
MVNERIQVLDCTLRDGGLGLEDAAKSGLSSVCFDSEAIDRVTNHLKHSRIDIIELGSIEITGDDRRKYAIYRDIESISKVVPKDRTENQMYAALYRGPDTPMDDIPQRQEGYCEAVRVIIRYSELRKSLDFCKGLAVKGYKVFVQPMLTMRYTDQEIQMCIDASNDMGAYALYFVDSYGYMNEQDISRFFERYDSGLDPSIRIGFHAHNNMNLAFSNAISFIQKDSARNLVVDSCILGIGQGAGNLQTEIITDYLNCNLRGNYNYNAILEACEIIEKYWAQNIWGYSVTRLLPAIHKTAYKYSVDLRNRYGLSLMAINHIFSNMPEELRHRYTPENTIRLLAIFGYGNLANNKSEE